MATLSSLLDDKTGVEHRGRLILLSDALTDGAFLLHHFLQDFLKTGHRVLLVSLLHTFLHYSSVASKFGVNLRKKKEEGKFVFVDGLSELLAQHFTSTKETASTGQGASESTGQGESESTGQGASESTGQGVSQSSGQGASEETPSSGSSSHRQDLTPSLTLDCDLKVSGALATIETLLMEEPQCLLIDDLSVLLSVGVALPDILVLVQRCVHLLTSSNGPCKGAGCLVVAMHQEGITSERGEEELLHRHLLHMCHLHCHAHGLATGYSRDVHGDVSVAWRDPSCCGEKPLPPQQTAQYKLSDRSVQVFARGLSTAVL